ncbi:hypothetical protein DYB30_005470, partial [Aphanomyces astaci]
MSSLEPFMLDDPTFPISNTMYGALNSAVSIPNMIVPFLGGHLLDNQGHKSILYFLLLMCIGQAIFTYAMDAHKFWLALVGRVVFGLGEGSVVAGARAILSYWFDRSELTFAMGVMIATSNASKMLAKATVAPLALHFGSYVYGLSYGLVVCVVSSLFALLLVKCTQALRVIRHSVRAQRGASTDLSTLVDPKLAWLTAYCNSSSHHHHQPPHHHPSNTTKGSKHNHGVLQPVQASTAGGFSIVFWLVVVLHVVFINAFHLFQNISSSYLTQVHGYSVVDAGYASSLAHTFVLVSPFVGLIIDYVGGRMVVVVASCFLGVVSYTLLVFTTWPPIVAMLLFSVCLAATPTILMASIPLSIDKSRFGLAFGIVEVIDGVGAFLGNVGLGYLRDMSGSYDAVMYFLLALTSFGLGLSLVLAWVDNLYGGNLSSATVNIPLVAPNTPPGIVSPLTPCSVPIPAVSVPNMLLPFVGVHVLDVQGHVSVVYFLLAMCVGHIVVTFALATHTFWLALVGRVVFGVGEGSVVVGARAMVSYWFDASELTFAMGVMVATTSVSKMLAKATFWVLVVLHVVFINVFHLFQNISSSYLYQVHGYSVVKSGLVSSLSHVLVLFSPLVGLVIDRLDGRVPIIVLSAVLGVVAYGLLLFTSTPSTVSLLIMSFCLASTPAVLMACVPLNIPKSQFGLTLAFGIVEVIDATGSTVGNLVVGCLRDAT